MDQFDDAPEDETAPPPHTTAFEVPGGRDTTQAAEITSFTRDKRDGVGYIDDDAHPEVEAQAYELERLQLTAVHGATSAGQPLEASVAEGGESEGGNELDVAELDLEDEVEEEESTDYEDSEGEVVYGVEDEDWEVADADFTKQFNRMRQSRAIMTPSTTNSTSNTAKAGPSLLPARNVHHRNRVSGTPKTERSSLAPRPNGVADSEESQMQGSRRQQLHSTVVHGLTAPFDGVASAPKSAYQYANQQGKEDRATVEGVLDPRTRTVLASMIRRGIVSAIEGCVSTGKEANVYLGIAPDHPPTTASTSIIYPDPYPTSLALKIYKTSILSFKTRSQYIEGEHRFKNSYSKVSNPRKMVKVWAEKELRNLRRLEEGGVRCPKVVEVRENVLVMEFLGKEDGKASPRLKDAEIPNADLAELYAEVLVTMRRIFHRCRLVHGDFSEYNILYHDAHLYIIDVSQSVEHDHPSAYEFLRADIRNVDDYFRKRSGGEVRTLGIKGTFDFIVNEKLRVWEKTLTADGVSKESEQDAKLEHETDEQDEEAHKDVIRNWLLHGVGMQAEHVSVPPNPSHSAASPAVQDTDTVSGMAQTETTRDGPSTADEVFMSSYIPRNMSEVVDPERDIDLMATGKAEDLIYAGIMGMGSKAQDESAAGRNADAEKRPVRRVAFADDEDEGESEDSEDGEDDDHEKRPRGFRHEDRDAKKERKKALKEENREKRKGKMPKAEKQKKIKASSGR